MPDFNKDSTSSSSSGDVSLKELIVAVRFWVKVVLSNWIYIFLFTIVGLALGYYYASRKVPMYTATTTFVLENSEKNSLSQYAGVAAMVGVDLSRGGGGGIFQGENIQELYKSRVMIEKSLLSKVSDKDEELLIERYINFNGLAKRWEQEKRSDLLALDFKSSKPASDDRILRLKDSLISEFFSNITKNMLTVGLSDKKSSIIKVDVSSPDELFSKSFNESLVSNVNDFYVQTKVMKSTSNIKILQQKTDSVRAALRGTIYTSANLLDATPNLNPIRQSRRVAPVQEAQAEGDAARAVLSQLVQNLELSKMSLLQEQPLIQVVDQPVFPLTVSKASVLKFSVLGGVIFMIIITIFFIVRHFLKTL